MASDGLGGLVCTLSDDHQTGAARASDPDEALADLLGALDNAAIKGSGECFWLREAGQWGWGDPPARQNDSAVGSSCCGVPAR